MDGAGTTQGRGRVAQGGATGHHVIDHGHALTLHPAATRRRDHEGTARAGAAPGPCQWRLVLSFQRALQPIRDGRATQAGSDAPCQLPGRVVAALGQPAGGQRHGPHGQHAVRPLGSAGGQRMQHQAGQRRGQLDLCGAASSTCESNLKSAISRSHANAWSQATRQASKSGGSARQAPGATGRCGAAAAFTAAFTTRHGGCKLRDARCAQGPCAPTSAHGARARGAPSRCIGLRPRLIAVMHRLNILPGHERRRRRRRRRRRGKHPAVRSARSRRWRCSASRGA